MRAIPSLALCLLAAQTALAADADTSVYAKREADWRNGAIVYQVFVDRFAPAANLAAKRSLYAAPRILKTWDQPAERGPYLEDQRLARHELEFWGGDLNSLRGKLDYVQGLGADVVYLNPIHLAFTNHKYDALDYEAISPEYGTREDLKQLAADLHQRKMRLVLDGVFNHMGRNAPKFQSALKDPASPWRQWFVFGKEYPGGARAWAGAQNLPELNLENPAVRQYIYGGRNSVVRQYLRDGADGWRLDVAFELGPDYLSELTRAAHQEKRDALVVGEIWNYPSVWTQSMDGVLNFALREIILRTANRQLDAVTAGQAIERMVRDVGLDAMLKSWIVLDNHDTRRLMTLIPEDAQRHLAQVLQFTLPGSPNLYYGSELGMIGGDDPEDRGPMRWDQANDNNPHLAWTRQLVKLRHSLRALRVGDFRLAQSDKLLAFERTTDKIGETVLVISNPGWSTVTGTVLPADPMLMNGNTLSDHLSRQKLTMQAGLLEVSLPPGGVMVLTPDGAPTQGYTPYKRVKF